VCLIKAAHEWIRSGELKRERPNLLSSHLSRFDKPDAKLRLAIYWVFMPRFAGHDVFSGVQPGHLVERSAAVRELSRERSSTGSRGSPGLAGAISAG
jgi:hypothetical protein